MNLSDNKAHQVLYNYIKKSTKILSAYIASSIIQNKDSTLMSNFSSFAFFDNFQKTKQVLQEVQKKKSEELIGVIIDLRGLSYFNQKKDNSVQELKEDSNKQQNNKQELSYPDLSLQEKSTSLKSNHFLFYSIEKSTPVTVLHFRVREKLHLMFGHEHFANQSIQFYCKGKLLSGSYQVTVNDVVNKYESNIFTCQRMETFG